MASKGVSCYNMYRYFIVIDDVWDIESWKLIRNGLDDNDFGSKIVITTRKHDVAKEVGLYYKMEPLPYESSKKLFHTRIFGCEAGCPEDLSQVSEKLLKKCGGVPLAIITTSSLLANKSRNIKVWNEVSDSIGSGLGSNDNMDNMRKILSLSYYDLPSPLKTCLLYLSIFPEDYEIEKDRLIWKWIAEDFVQQGEESQSLFEIGESYFNELLNRSLIQVAYTNVDDTIRSCRVHDMVLELICSLSRQKNFVTTVLGDGMQRTPPSAGSKKVRRLSLQNTAWPTMEMSILRSIAIFSSSEFNVMPSLSCCHLLRVLDLQDCNLRDLPNLRFVGNLFHLRYLSLAYSGYSGELPAEIGKLQFLQTLELCDTQINELPSSIIGLRQLIYLCGNESTRLPNGLRCLTLLEVFFQVSVDSACMAEELGHLMQLRMLSVRLRKDKNGRWDENLCAAFVRSLAKLHKINRLLVFSNDVAADLDGSVESLGNLSFLYINQATSLPTWISPALLPLLSNLNITMVQVRTDDICVLGMLQALRVLRVDISGEVQVLERFAVSTHAFPCAINCSFTCFSMAPSAFPPGAMPRLEQLHFCIWLEDFAAGGKLVGDDLALGHLPCLQSVVVDLRGKKNVSKDVVTEVKEKLRHEVDAHPNKPNIYFN
jgi:disease resistance protein RPM1